MFQMFWTTFVFMSTLKTYSHTFSLSLTLTFSHSHTLSISHSLTLDMLNNFCFHVYAQNLLSHFLTLTLSHSFSLSAPRLSLWRFILTVVIDRNNDIHDEYEEMHVSDLIDFDDKRPEVVIAKAIDKIPHLPSSSSLPPGETVGSFDAYGIIQASFSSLPWV